MTNYSQVTRRRPLLHWLTSIQQPCACVHSLARWCLHAFGMASNGLPNPDLQDLSCNTLVHDGHLLALGPRILVHKLPAAHRIKYRRELETTRRLSPCSVWSIFMGVEHSRMQSQLHRDLLFFCQLCSRHHLKGYVPPLRPKYMVFAAM